MSIKKLNIIFLILSLVGVFSGFILFNPQSIGICDPTDRFGCINFFRDEVSQPLLYGLLPVALVFFVLIFTSQNVFNTWKKFALVFIPLGTLAIITTPIECDAILNGCLDKELVTWWIGGLYLVISLLIIVYKQFIRPGKVQTK